MVQHELVDYLRQRSPHPDTPLDVVIADAVLGAASNGRSTSIHLADFQHATGARKRLVLSTVLALFGPVPPEWRTDPAVIGYRGYAVWTELTLCATKVLSAAALGWDEDAVREDQDELLRRLRSFGAGGVWEGNALAHLIALHALHAYRPSDPLIPSGMGMLAAVRNADGGVPFVAGQEVFVTALAGTALAASGICPATVLQRIGDYIASRQLSDGGWGYHWATTQSDVDDTSRCTTFLRSFDPPRYEAHLRRAEGYLAGMVHPQGGFPTYLAGHPPEIDMTAVAVTALAPAWAMHATVVEPCIEYLVNSQRADGTFERGWTLSESSTILVVARALWQVLGHTSPSSRRIQQVLDRCAVRLSSTQNADGGWGQTPGLASDVLSTSQAVPVIARAGSQRSLENAAVYLLQHQNTDGGFTSIADQVGPRPLPFDFPDLANVHALAAFNAVSATLEGWVAERPTLGSDSDSSHSVEGDV